MHRSIGSTVLLAALVVISAGALLRWPGGDASAPAADLVGVRSLGDRLAASHRVARLLVLGQQADGKGGLVSQCLFGEYSADGSSLVGVREFRVGGDRLVIGGRTLVFGQQAIPAEVAGRTVHLFVSAKPAGGGDSIPLEAPGMSPDFYSSGQADIPAAEADFWSRVWTNSQGATVQSAEATLQLAPGSLYNIQFEPGGSLTAWPTPIDAQASGMLHKNVIIW